MTYGKYLAAVLELKDGFCTEGGDAGATLNCQQEYKKRLAARTGFDSSMSVHNIFDCLANQSEDRDTRGWHTFKVKYKEQLAPDCSEVDLVIPDGNALPEVGKHPPSELVQGCGEPQ